MAVPIQSDVPPLAYYDWIAPCNLFLGRDNASANQRQNLWWCGVYAEIRRMLGNFWREKLVHNVSTQSGKVPHGHDRFGVIVLMA